MLGSCLSFPFRRVPKVHVPFHWINTVFLDTKNGNTSFAGLQEMHENDAHQSSLLSFILNIITLVCHFFLEENMNSLCDNAEKI